VTLSANLAAYTATALTDATGLSFAVVAGTFYRFTFWVVFQSAATTTGIQLSINAPTSDRLWYNVDIPLSATGRVLGNRRAVNVASIGSGVDAINVPLQARIEGHIRPTANGTLIVRYSSEIAASGVIVMAGSTGELVVL
jgi:hypothetical protein